MPGGRPPSEGAAVPGLKVAVVIPARLGSTRFPRKVLARDTGKYLVEHVHERVKGCPGIDAVVIATDSDEVLRACRSFGAEAVLTSPDHASGTDRVAEVARGLTHGVIINVQGDEPLIAHADLEALVRLFHPPGGGRAPGDPCASTCMATLVAEREDLEGFLDPNIVKAVVAADGHALYFSRAPVPYDRDGRPAAHVAGRGPEEPKGGTVRPWYQHIGIYAYRRDFLLELAKLSPTPLERREKLEQLRVLEHGYRIRVDRTHTRHLGIDTEEEYRKFVAEHLQSKKGF